MALFCTNDSEAMIRFLLKSIFWLSLAFIVLPRMFPPGPEDRTPEKIAATPAPKQPDAVGRLVADGRSALQIGKVCADNPAFCEKGAALASSAGSGGREGSRAALEYLSSRFGGKPAATPAKPEPAAAPVPAVAARATAGTPGFIPVPTPRAEALRAISARN